MCNGYGKGEWSFGNNSAKNFIIFGADNSSSYHTDNLKNDFLTLGFLKTQLLVLILFRIGFFGAADGWGGKGKKTPPPYTLPHISYNDETWHSYTLPKNDPTV